MKPSKEAKEGMTAYQLRQPKDANPYPRGSTQWAQWEAGYDYAKNIGQEDDE